MRILGLDVGSRTIGVAVSDALGLSAHGVTTLRRSGLSKDIRAVQDVMQAYGVREVVVGLPRNMNGSLGPQARRVQAFAEKLRAAVAVPVVLWDERLTSREAERVLVEADMSRRKRRAVVDRVAAVLILQGYLERRRARTGKAQP